MAAQTRSGVAGMSRCETPTNDNASSTADITQGGAAIAPA